MTSRGIAVAALEVGFAAVDAHNRFGTVRHAAALNFGDGIVNAASKVLDQSILFKGSDFALTDVHAA